MARHLEIEKFEGNKDLCSQAKHTIKRVFGSPADDSIHWLGRLDS
jgi:hypothetical protein